MEEQNQRGFRGVWIPVEILDSKDLSVAEKFIYAYLSSFNKVCFESNERIAEKTGTSIPTVTRALAKLQAMQYVFVELIKNNNAKRRIYAIYDDPRKMAYLIKKGLFTSGVKRENESFPHSNQIDETRVESNQNDEMSNQNDETQNGGESNQIDYHRYKNTIRKKENPEQKPNNTSAGLAGSGPASRLDIKRETFNNDYEYEKEFYKRNTINLGTD